VYAGLRSRLNFPYLVRRNGVFVLIDPSLTERVARMAQILGESAEGEYARAYFFRMRRDMQRANEVMRLAIDQYPDDANLREEFLRNHFGELATGTAPAEIAEVAAGLGARSRELLAAAGHAIKSDWRAVAMADERLAEIPWIAAWYPEALELRVDWRTRVTSGGQARRFGDEAIPMIDRVAVLNPTLQLFGMRTRAGIAAQRPSVVVESVSSYARLAANMVRARVIAEQAFRTDAVALRNILVEAEKLKGADAARIAEVRAELDRLAPTS
jgi:hypothetical protein